MTKTRAQRTASLEQWADHVEADDLVEADTALLDATRAAREADRSWSEIATMLGVSE